MNSSVFVDAFHKTLWRIRHPLRTHRFMLLAKSSATYCAAAKRQRQLCLCSECVEVWVVMQIANCAGHRGKSEGNGSLPARHAEGGTNWCEPPSFLSLSLLLSPFHSLYPKLAAGRQMNAVWSEPTEVLGPAVQATKELHARHLLFSYQNTFSHVPAFPSLSPHSSSTTATQHPFRQLRASLFLPPTSPQWHSSPECCWSVCPPLTTTTTTIPMNIHSFATIILLPTSSLACCLYLNSVGLADNPTLLPICSEMHWPYVNDHNEAWGNSRLNLNEPRSHRQK